jgi:WD40 repeat protein
VEPGKNWRICVIAAAGGKMEQIISSDPLAEIDPSWSPDGNSIVFGRPVEEAAKSIQRVDLKTHAISTVSGSKGLFSPRLSPDGRYIAALPADTSKLMLYDFRTGRWRTIGRSGTYQFNIWSRDAKKVYLLHKDESTEIVRFDVAGQRFEPVASLKDVEQGNREWVGLAEDESPLLVLDKSVSDVYRLDLRYP